MNREMRMSAIGYTRAELREIIFDYVMEDVHRLEIFTDLEACTIEEYVECVDTLYHLLDDMETSDMADIVDRIEHEDEYDTYYEIFYGVNPSPSLADEEEDSDERVGIFVEKEDLAKVLLCLDINGIDWRLF